MTTEKYTSNTYKIGEIIEITELHNAKNSTHT